VLNGYSLARAILVWIDLADRVQVSKGFLGCASNDVTPFVYYAAFSNDDFNFGFTITKHLVM
jgi:hypothetical protein